MAIHVVGYRTAVDGKGKPMTIPTQTFVSDFSTESDAIAFIKSNAPAAGKAVMFSLSGEADAPSEISAPAVPAQADAATIALSIVDYALAQMGTQLTALLSDEWLCHGLTGDDYDSLVIAQNSIVEIVQKLEAGYEAEPDQCACPLNAPEEEGSE